MLVIGDVNMTTENTHLNDLLQIYDLTALIQEPTCYQSQNSNCIDHFLTNQKTLFKHCQTFETGFSHKGSNSKRITLLENYSILTDDQDIPIDIFFHKYYQKFQFYTIEGLISK